MADITKDTPVDVLVQAKGDIVKLLIREGLPCIVCGEPFWGSVAELAKQKGWTDEAIDRLVEKINEEIDKAS